jgi:hypothetical protein
MRSGFILNRLETSHAFDYRILNAQKTTEAEMDDEDEGRRVKARPEKAHAPRRSVFIGCFALDRAGTWERKQRRLAKQRSKSNTSNVPSHSRRLEPQSQFVVETEARPRKRQRADSRTTFPQDAEQVVSVSSRVRDIYLAASERRLADIASNRRNHLSMRRHLSSPKQEQTRPRSCIMLH